MSKSPINVDGIPSNAFIISDYEYDIYYLTDENFKCIVVLQNPFKVIEFTDFADKVIKTDKDKYISIYRNCIWRKSQFKSPFNKFDAVIYHDSNRKNCISGFTWIKSNQIDSLCKS
jgi:hypothetical protein